MKRSEPIYHSHISDELPEGHPMALASQYCKECKGMVHAFNNECMSPWFEWEDSAICFDCFGDPEIYKRVIN